MHRDRPLNEISRSPSLSRYRWTHTRTVLSLVAPGGFSTSAAPSSAAAACLRRKTTSVFSTRGPRFGCLHLIKQVESCSHTQSTRDLRFLKSMATNSTYHNYSEGDSRILRNEDTLLPDYKGCHTPRGGNLHDQPTLLPTIPIPCSSQCVQLVNEHHATGSVALQPGQPLNLRVPEDLAPAVAAVELNHSPPSST
jgi:hypothetical protein